MKRSLADKIMYLSPRILSIIFALFLLIFALDSSSIIGFLIHLVPSLLVITLLVISWKKECFGSWLFIMLGGAFMMYFKTYTSISSFMMISFPLFLIGLLFLYDCVMFDDPIRKKAKRISRASKRK